MNAEALLLDERVVTGRIDLQAGGERDGAERAVQGERDVVGLRHGGDLLALGDAARVGEVGLDDVDVPVHQKALEVPAREHALAEWRSESRCRPRDIAQRFDVLGQHRLLDEHRPVGLELLREHACAMGRCTRPWKSTPMPTCGPTASRTVATRATAASIGGVRVDESGAPRCAFIFTAMKPHRPRLLAATPTSAGRSPPIQE